MSVKKIIKCFIPYGFIVLLRGINRVIKGFPFRDIKYKTERDINAGYFYEISAKNMNGDGNIVQILRENYKHPIFIRNFTSDVGVYQSIIEKEEYNFSVKYKPKYIIDAGANIGMASIYFANRYEDTIIIAIEPEENNFNLLKRNTEKYDNIIAIKAALWNEVGEISLFDTNLDNDGFMVETNETALKPSIKKIKHYTKTITIEKILTDYNIDRIDILKVDIEGSEKEIFESCKNWIDKTKCVIIE